MTNLDSDYLDRLAREYAEAAEQSVQNSLGRADRLRAFEALLLKAYDEIAGKIAAETSDPPRTTGDTPINDHGSEAREPQNITR